MRNFQMAYLTSASAVWQMVSPNGTHPERQQNLRMERGCLRCTPDLESGTSLSFCLVVSMQSEAPLTWILSPLRAGRGELEHTCLGSLFGDPDTVPPKAPLSLRKRERVRVRVRLDCMDTAQRDRWASERSADFSPQEC